MSHLQEVEQVAPPPTQEQQQQQQDESDQLDMPTDIAGDALVLVQGLGTKDGSLRVKAATPLSSAQELKVPQRVALFIEPSPFTYVCQSLTCHLRQQRCQVVIEKKAGYCRPTTDETPETLCSVYSRLEKFCSEH